MYERTVRLVRLCILQDDVPAHRVRSAKGIETTAKGEEFCATPLLPTEENNAEQVVLLVSERGQVPRGNTEVVPTLQTTLKFSGLQFPDVDDDMDSGED